MGSSNETSHSTTNTNQTITPINPTWVTNGLSGLGQTLSGLNGLDPYSLVSGPTLQHQTAAGSVQNLGGLSNLDLNNAGALLTSSLNLGAPTIDSGGGPASMTAASLLPGLSSGQYMNPYLSSVVRSSLADYDVGAGQTQAQNKLALANDTTFGGSGGAIQTALSNDAITRGRAALSSGLLSQGYSQAAGLANEDADRQQQASLTNAQLAESAKQRAYQASLAQAQADQQANQLRQAAAVDLANVGGATDANTRANATTQASIGDLLRQIQQQQLAAPLSTAATLGGIWGSLPLGLLHGQNEVGQTTSDSSTTYTPSLMSQIGQGIGLASSLAGLGLGSGLGLTPMTPLTSTVEPLKLFSGSLTSPSFSFVPGAS